MDDPSKPEAFFRARLAEGRLMLQRPRRGGKTFFYPRVSEPGTGDRDLEWVELSGLGTVYSTTVVRRLPEKGGDYNIALVDFDEGGRLMTRVTGISPDAVRIDMRVKARIDQINNEHAILFEPAEGK